MKLYEIPKESIIHVWNPNKNEYIEFIFHYLDGAYSYCTNGLGCILHLSVNTELEKISDKEYKICQITHQQK